MTDVDRYSRQVLFSCIGVEGQRRILESRAVIIGLGALGTAQADALARAGVGHLILVDRDFLEESNLQRQTLFDEEDVKAGLPKAVAAERRLRKVNSTIKVEGLVEDVNHTNIEEIVRGADVILDATDNFETRFLINDVSVKLNVPWIYGACVSSYGISMTIVPGETPCLRCLFDAPPPMGSAPTCETAGVIAPIVSVVASLQVTEALKILSGNKGKISRKLANIDVWEGRFKLIDITHARRSDCPTCALRKFEYLFGKGSSLGVVLCGRNAVQIQRACERSVNFQEVAQRLKAVGEVVYNDFVLKAKIDGYEIALFADGRGIVKGTQDIGVARSIFAKYIGG